MQTLTIAGARGFDWDGSDCSSLDTQWLRCWTMAAKLDIAPLTVNAQCG
jgi:hypothetical protein